MYEITDEAGNTIQLYIENIAELRENSKKDRYFACMVNGINHAITKAQYDALKALMA